MSDNQEFLIEEELPDHIFYTQMPNILDDLDLDPIDFRIYMRFKRIAGDKGRCWQSLDAIAKHINISRSRLKIGIKNLEQGNNKHNLKLILKIERTKQDGSKDTSIFKILDIWSFNREYYKKGGGGSPENRGVGHQKTEGGSPENHKEEPVKEKPYKEQQHSERGVAPVVVFSEDQEREIEKTANDFKVSIKRLKELKEKAKCAAEFMESLKAFRQYATKEGMLENATATLTSAITQNWKVKLSKESTEQNAEQEKEIKIKKVRDEIQKITDANKDKIEKSIEVKVYENRVQIKHKKGSSVLGFLEENCINTFIGFFENIQQYA